MSHSPPHRTEAKKPLNNIDADEIVLPSDRSATGFANLVARQQNLESIIANSKKSINF
jgi:hypothetical protein